MRIVFMGTPEYSAKTLKALYEAGHDIVAVFAQPDKPVGRKQVMTSPPTKAFAIEKGIAVYQPKTLRNGDAAAILKEINPDIIVVVAYGKILPKEVLMIPRFGCVNGHASLLPRHRGSSPIQWAIISGDKTTGVTTMLMDEGIDTGDILDKAIVEIGENETSDELFERLSTVSAELMVKTLSSIEKGLAKPIKQPDEGATYTPIIEKEMAHIDFNETASEICNRVRGFYSWPCAFCFIEGKRVKVIAARPYSGGKGKCGTVTVNEKALVVASGDDTAVELVTVQPEGSKQMNAADWLRGHKIPLETEVK